ncbi:unnamed protein product [Ostreobium quekettii]|uniref:SHSP domain-containing protein n=1 Tax=Ostreobium quekettii TaxID=121088 RepID=A0A8S1IX94_9CHLO|nr:unnamed protein product [Ostreobium quekettii]
MALCRAAFPDVFDGLMGLTPVMGSSLWRDGFIDNGERSRTFPTDVVERDDAFELTTDVPGMEPGDIMVEVKEGVLVVKGERKEATEGKDEEGRVVRQERRHRRFERRFRLGEVADREGVSARLERGVLTVTVPKREAPKPRRVEVVEASGAEE